MPTIYLALGSNLGDRKTNLDTAIDLLRHKVCIEEISSVYETEAAYVTDQPPFLNLVLRAETNLSPAELLAFLKGIEQEMGREKTIRFGPRLVDVDILLYGDERIGTPTLIVPHPRMTERAFVLVPLAEIAPTLEIPGTGESVSALLSALGDAGRGDIIQRIETDNPL